LSVPGRAMSEVRMFWLVFSLPPVFQI